MSPPPPTFPKRLTARFSLLGLFLGLLAFAARLDARPKPAAAPAPQPPPPAPDAPQPAGSPSQQPAPQKRAPQQRAPQQPHSPRSIPRPFEGNYPASLTSAIVALAPFIVITTAYAMFSKQVGQDLHASRTALEIIAGLSTAGYAWGALLGGDLMQRLHQRRVFFAAEAAFALGCLLSAVAQGAALYAAGRVLSGFATGLLLVAALPPVIQRFPAAKLPLTVIFVNVGFFGAVCIGPLLGGWVDAGHHWRWFYGALGILGAANIGLAVLTLPDQEPFNPGLKFDALALALGFAAVVLPFWASGELGGHDFTALRFTLPLGAGAVCFIALLLAEFRQKEPLAPVKLMWNTPSVTGTLTAMIGGGVFVAFLELAERFHMQVAYRSPLETGVLFWPLAVSVLISATAFGAILRTRLIPLLILAGMACLIAGGALLTGLTPQAGPGLTLGAAALLGLGAGATVSPGLYLAGFPLPSQIIGRVFALVELVRSLADYIIAPVMMRIAQEGSAGKTLSTGGVHLGIEVTLWLTIGFTVFGVLLYVLSRGELPRPDLEGWLAKRNPAIRPVPLLGRLRRRNDTADASG